MSDDSLASANATLALQLPHLPARASQILRDVAVQRARELAEATSPDSDVHASGAYRKRLAAVLTRRALAEAIGGAL